MMRNPAHTNPLRMVSCSPGVTGVDGWAMLHFSEAPDSVTGHLVACWMVLRCRAELDALAPVIAAHLAGDDWYAANVAAVRKAFDLALAA